MAAMSVRNSMANTIDDAFSYRLYDVEVRFSRPYRIDRIKQNVRDVPGVVRVEPWGWVRATRVRADDTEGDPFNVIAPPATTELIEPIIIEGRWLLPGDENALVINHELLDIEPDISVDDGIALKVNERETTWEVVGIAKEAMAMPNAYTNYAYFAKATRLMGYAGSVRIVTEGHDEASHEAVAQSLEQNLEDAGLDVILTEWMTRRRIIIEDHFALITDFLMATSILIAVVGGLGLASTMSINVIERTREIGIMRAIGASTRSVLQIIVVEGVLIGLLSWCIASVFALPLSIIISNILGTILMQTTLSFAFSFSGLVTWFVIVVVFTAIASFSPAWSASRLTVRDVLAYE